MKTLVIVDNELLLAKALGETIEAFGDFKVPFVCANGLEMVNRFKDPKAVPDIVLLDVFMSPMDGFESAEWLTANHPSVKILALSFSDKSKHVIRMIRCGARGYLLKDIDAQDLKAALHFLVEKGYYHSEWLSQKLVENIANPEQPNGKISLNDREMQFLRLAASELTYKEIAEKMILSPRTIEGYRDQLFEKFALKTRVGLILFALKEQVLTLEEIQVGQN